MNLGLTFRISYTMLRYISNVHEHQAQNTSFVAKLNRPCKMFAWLNIIAKQDEKIIV